jgi:hypothetical protein
MNHSSHNAPSHDWTSLLTSAQRLRITMVACRVRFTWLGVEKALTPEQNARAAQRFEATPQFLRAAKKLLDVHHPAFRALTSLRGQIESYWRSLTLPFPEPCLRLIPLDQVEAFDRQMTSYRMQLSDTAIDLERNFDQLRAEAVRQLGSLFDPADYPATLRDLFGVRWDFPNLEPPPNLTWLSRSVHQLEEYHVQILFEEAVRLADRMFYGEFTRLVAHLGERISGDSAAGSPKIFRDSAVDNLVDFLAGYRRFNLGSDDRLNELIDLVERTLQGVTPQRLRDHAGLRRTVASRLSWVQASLAAMAEDPREGENRPDAPDPAVDDD